MKICTICNDRMVLCKEKCNRCYYAVRNGSESDFQRIKRQNFCKDNVHYLGTKFIVDKEDYENLKEYSWSDNGGGYGKNGKMGYLHRAICPQYTRVDHINRNTYDNRKSNLREGIYINVLNTDKRKKPCPIWQTRQGLWYGQTTIKGKKYYIKASPNRCEIVRKLEKILKDAGRLHFYQLQIK